MTPKERLLAALARQKPDRLPVTVHQWQQYHLDTYMGGLDDLAANRAVGFDAQIQYFESMDQFWLTDADFTKLKSVDWRDEAVVVSSDPDHRVVHHDITTPRGKLTYKTEGDRKTTWITEYLIKRDEDIDLIRDFMPVPRLDPVPVASRYDQVGDHGILRGFVWGDQAGCWQHAACLMDINALMMAAIDKPDWVHALLKILLEKKLRFIESMRGARFDLIETGGGSASSTAYLAPHARRVLPALRQGHARRPARPWASWSPTTPAAAPSASRSSSSATAPTPPRRWPRVSIGGNQEPWEFKRKIAGRLALIGGVDQHNTLTTGSREDIRRAVFKLFETVGDQGGYICSASDHFFETPVANLKAFAEAAHECRY